MKILSRQQHEQESWLKEIASPGTPTTGYVAVYAKSDGKIYRKDDAGTEVELGGGGGGSPAGSTGQIQFNTAGSFDADANLHWDDTNKRLGIGTATPVSPLTVVNNIASIVPISAYAHASQAAPVFKIYNSSGTISLVDIDPYLSSGASASSSIFNVTSGVDFNTPVPPYFFGSFFSVKNANGVKVFDIYKGSGAGNDVNFTVQNVTGTESFTIYSSGGLLGLNKNSTQIFRIGGVNIINFENKASVGQFDQNGYAALTVTSVTSSNVSVIARGAASQTADLFQARDISDTVLSRTKADGNIEVPDEAYSSSWNGKTEVPTKNAIRDKIEAMSVTGITRSVIAQSANFTAGAAALTDYVYIVDASAGTITVTLPTAVGNTNKYLFVNTDVSAINSIVFNTTSGQTINTEPSGSVAILGNSFQGGISFISDGANWWIDSL